jgi:hypothetical protein
LRAESQVNVVGLEDIDDRSHTLLPLHLSF